MVGWTIIAYVATSPAMMTSLGQIKPHLTHHAHADTVIW